MSCCKNEQQLILYLGVEKMLVITNTDDIEKAEFIPKDVQFDILQSVYILDSAYGKGRDIFKDLGGFCCIIQNDNDIQYLKRNWNIDIYNDISELSVKINGYTKRLFILSSDYCIVSYIKID